MHARRFVAAALVLAGALAAPAPMSAQGVLGRLKKKAEDAAKKKIEERADKRAGEAADKALDTAECAASDRLCKERKEQAAAAAAGSSGSGKGTAVTPAARVGEGAWVNYDFKPGDKPLFVEDFTRDEVGNFPRRLELVDGNMEIAEWNGARYLRATTRATFDVPIPETLPERFTFEVDVKLGSLNGARNFIYFSEDKDQYSKATRVDIFGYGFKGSVGTLHAGLTRPNGPDTHTQLPGEQTAGDLLPLRVMADGRYVKLYVGGTRAANVPNADLGRSRAIRFIFLCSTEEPCFFGAIRVMAGGKKLYEALSESGRVATQGIFFATGSDEIRPESTPTLKEIGQMLADHPELRLAIEGHTDNVGDAKANLALSEKRAAAVRAYLVAKHGIEQSRLTAKGLGATKPAAANTTPEGRQQNRRVELVKL